MTEKQVIYLVAGDELGEIEISENLAIFESREKAEKYIEEMKTEGTFSNYGDVRIELWQLN